MRNSIRTSFITRLPGLFHISRGQLDAAIDHIHKFSKLLRSYIQSSRSKLITIAEEQENLRNYIELQQSRFQGKFDYHIVNDPGLPIEQLKIPVLLLQPLVENAINHGLFYRKENGHLNLTFRKTGIETIQIVIDDNGVGRQKSSKLNNEKSSESVGGQLTDELINTYSKYESITLGIEYIDKEEPAQGTTVIITIKYHPPQRRGLV